VRQDQGAVRRSADRSAVGEVAERRADGLSAGSDEPGEQLSGDVREPDDPPFGSALAPAAREVPDREQHAILDSLGLV
jgi:hypothetical protein